MKAIPPEIHALELEEQELNQQLEVPCLAMLSLRSCCVLMLILTLLVLAHSPCALTVIVHTSSSSLCTHSLRSHCCCVHCALAVPSSPLRSHCCCALMALSRRRKGKLEVINLMSLQCLTFRQ